MEGLSKIPSFYEGSVSLSENNSKQKVVSKPPVTKKRGRPKGAVSASLSDVRKQATEERRQLKLQHSQQVAKLQAELDLLRRAYDEDVGSLAHELELSRRRESNYQQALGERLVEVAGYLQETLLNWGAAELEEAQIDKRKRGRPRKTLK